MINSSLVATPTPSQIWVVAACFNEEAVISKFLERLLPIKDISHVLLIDDGSNDETVNKIRSFQSELEAKRISLKITLIELTRNFGKEAAMLAGLDYSSGKCDALVLIDSDLQHPPELITSMISLWRDGAEIVTAVRDDKDQESLFKVTTAHWFYKVFNHLADSIQLIEGAGDFRLLSAPVIRALTDMRECSRFSKGLVPWTGFRSEQIKYNRKSRPAGRSSWSIWKLWRYALDGIFSFSVLPLKVWSFLGLSASILSIVYAIFIILQTFFKGVDVPGYASLMVAVLFLGGIQLIGIGVLGDYLGRVYVDAKSRPHYFIRQIYY